MKKSKKSKINPYKNRYKHHEIVEGKVVCISHMCDWHDRTEQDFKKGKLR